MNYYNEYNNPITFKGDIIITDPCYLMRKQNFACREKYPEVPYPDYDDYYPYGTIESKYPDLMEKEITLTDSKEDLEKAFSHLISNHITFFQYQGLRLHQTPSLTFTVQFSPMYHSAKKSYEKAYSDYCSAVHDDWDYCYYGKNMDALGINNCAVARTLYGDWGCTVYANKPSQPPLGQFCADSGLVGVFLVEEVMKYNPDAIKELRERTWCATFINNFDGDITFSKVKNHDDDEEELRLVGYGNVKFVSMQTDF